VRIGIRMSVSIEQAAFDEARRLLLSVDDLAKIAAWSEG
jgi:hypothetical protein